jgi:hypothetical protein
MVDKKYGAVNKTNNSQNCQDRSEYSLDVHSYGMFKMDPIKLCQRSPYLHISLWFNPWGNNYPRQYRCQLENQWSASDPCLGTTLSLFKKRTTNHDLFVELSTQHISLFVEKINRCLTDHQFLFYETHFNYSGTGWTQNCRAIHIK